MQRFAEEHPDQATVQQGPGYYSITIHGNYPELMPNFSHALTLIMVGIVVIVFLLAATVVRCLHDRGKSGVWGLMPIPFIVFALIGMLMLFKQFSQGAASDLSPYLSLFFALFLNNILYFASLVFLIVLLSGESTKGENRYGPEPAG